MSSEKPQSYENHARWVPLYHFVLSTVLLANLVWSVCLLVRGFSWPTVLGVLVALALFGILFYARFFALRVQDRVIRLEMRLRLKDVLPADLQGRIAELTPDQLIGLRFAGDDEIAALAREALERNLTRQQIKQKIRHWRADHYRA